MITVDRRDFLKQAATAVVGLSTGGIALGQLVARDASHDLAVVVSGILPKKKMVEHAWKEAKRQLGVKHFTSIWDGAFIPERVKLKQIVRDEWFSTRIVFELSGKQIAGMEKPEVVK